MEPSYSPQLQVMRPRGFGEVFDRRFTIYTPARQRLEFLLRNMPGGSIGIAGSRGAGKTTLLRNFCGPKRIITKLNNKTVLGILVSAPVAYEARDFLLYLFSTACRCVIEAEGGKLPLPFVPDDLSERLQNVRTLPELHALPRVLTSFGLGFLVLGLIVALA